MISAKIRAERFIKKTNRLFWLHVAFINFSASLSYSTQSLPLSQPWPVLRWGHENDFFTVLSNMWGCWCHRYCCHLLGSTKQFLGNRHAVKCVVWGLVCLCDGICQIEFSTRDEGEISAAVYGSLAADFTLNILDTISSTVSQQGRC